MSYLSIITYKYKSLLVNNLFLKYTKLKTLKIYPLKYTLFSQMITIYFFNWEHLKLNAGISPRDYHNFLNLINKLVSGFSRVRNDHPMRGHLDILFVI